MSKARKLGSKFVDSLRICVKGGAGGHGHPKYGGVGGRGGDVCLEGAKFSGLNTFLKKYPHRNISAENGGNSSKYRLVGIKGNDKVVQMPVGIVVYNEKDNKKIGELNEIGEKLVVARGGKGGSPKGKPQYTGLKGEERIVTLDLKIIADIGLVGFPNAGKSTLLKAISRAKPEIAAYAFTTLKPNLGVLEYSDGRQISMADLPGLVEGASENVGMGHKFLKHVERTSVLLMVVDINGFQYKPQMPHRSCLETIILLNKELELYDSLLVQKPALLAVNKMDTSNSDEKFEELKKQLNELKKYVQKSIPEELRPEKVMKFRKVIPISARYNMESVNILKEEIRSVLDNVYYKSMKPELKKKEKELLRDMKNLSEEVGAQYI